MYSTQSESIKNRFGKPVNKSALQPIELISKISFWELKRDFSYLAKLIESSSFEIR